MGEFRNYRKYRKNVYEEFYFLHKDEFEFKLDSNDDPETNFPYHISRDADLSDLKDACVESFARNFRLLKRRRRKRNLQFFFIYGILYVEYYFLLKHLMGDYHEKISNRNRRFRGNWSRHFRTINNSGLFCDRYLLQQRKIY